MKLRELRPSASSADCCGPTVNEGVRPSMASSEEGGYGSVSQVAAAPVQLQEAQRPDGEDRPTIRAELRRLRFARDRRRNDDAVQFTERHWAETSNDVAALRRWAKRDIFAAASISVTVVFSIVAIALVAVSAPPGPIFWVCWTALLPLAVKFGELAELTAAWCAWPDARRPCATVTTTHTWTQTSAAACVQRPYLVLHCASPLAARCQVRAVSGRRAWNPVGEHNADRPLGLSPPAR